MTDPYANLEPELAAFERALNAYFAAISASLPASKVNASITTGSLNPIVQIRNGIVVARARGWAEAAATFEARLRTIEAGLLRNGIAQGIAEIPRGAPALSARIGDLAAEVGGRRAVELVQAIDQATAAGLRQLIGTASRSYAGDQSLGTLRRLQADIRAQVGVTPKQAARIERWRVAAEKAGLDAKAVQAGVEQRAASAIDLRASAIADRGVIESISEGRHRSWVEARDAGDLPQNVLKSWLTQGDRRVRARHRAQGNEGPIPLDQLFSILHVMYPPADEPGCRCWSGLVIP